ncbi:MAG: serine acetyltransferase [Rhodopirellula sp.]|nr:serine acetyltransferase [Rhodopirellula sp.]|tara:strand:+ start:12821 stop:13777 length:957 start_codon:yes stop_codon:yes gene_type:complete
MSSRENKQQLPGLTNQIINTYEDLGTINHLDHIPLPQLDKIIEILNDFKEVLYPGYRRRQGLHGGNVSYYVGNLVDRIFNELSTQIARALQHEDVVFESRGEWYSYLEQGEQLTLKLLERLPEIRRVLATDVQAAYDGDPACKSLDEVIFCYPGLDAITVHRIAHELYLLNVPFIPRMMAEWSHKETGIDIHPGATIGESFFIDHGTGVVIGETTVIGKQVKLYQGVTLGALSFPTDSDGNIIRTMKRHPTIDDRVVVYASATILGGETIVGHDSVIGSSVWLTRSVQPHTTVTLEKPKLRMRADSKEAVTNDSSFEI